MDERILETYVNVRLVCVVACLEAQSYAMSRKPLSCHRHNTIHISEKTAPPVRLSTIYIFDSEATLGAEVAVEHADRYAGRSFEPLSVRSSIFSSTCTYYMHIRQGAELRERTCDSSGAGLALAFIAAGNDDGDPVRRMMDGAHL